MASLLIMIRGMHTMKSLPVHRLSSILTRVARELRDRFGLTRLAIGGGSAPALLDHLFSGNALRMRDLDLVLIADRPVDRELVERIGMALDAPDLRFLPRYLYPRRRARGTGDLWVAGWGALWDAEGTEVDLSVFHDGSALELNGLMNIDRILIPSDCDRSLNEVAAEMLTLGSAEAAVRAGLACDPCNGYAGWVDRSPAVVAWPAVQASPIECAIRIVRACVSKLHIAELRPELAGPLRGAVVGGSDRGDPFVRVRNFVKLFHDEDAGAELEMMHALGAFTHWLPEIGEAIERLGDGGLTAVFNQTAHPNRRISDPPTAFAANGEQGGDARSALRLEALLLNIPSAHRDRVLDEVAVAEPAFAARVREQVRRAACRRISAPVHGRRTAFSRSVAAHRVGGGHRVLRRQIGA
jgi:hypothetical protein